MPTRWIGSWSFKSTGMPCAKGTSGGPLARGPASQRGGALAPSTSSGIHGGVVLARFRAVLAQPTGNAKAREAGETATVQTATARGPSGRDLPVAVTRR
eukprot:6690867-Pyramimonas_sp.AAC.1